MLRFDGGSGQVPVAFQATNTAVKPSVAQRDETAARWVAALQSAARPAMVWRLRIQLVPCGTTHPLRPTFARIPDVTLVLLSLPGP